MEYSPSVTFKSVRLFGASPGPGPVPVGVRLANQRTRSSARGQANKTSADGHDCEAAPGGKADALFAVKLNGRRRLR